MRTHPSPVSPIRISACLRRMAGLFLVLVVLQPATLARPALAQDEQLTEIRVLDSQPAYLDVEFTASADLHPSSLISHPSPGALLGVPTTAGLDLEVIAADYDAFPSYRLAPAPPMSPTETEADDPSATWLNPPADLHSSSGEPSGPLHPSLVSLGATGYLADQPVAQLQFHPVQPDPSGQGLRIYRRITARLTWQPTVAAAQSSTPVIGPAHEQLLAATLLNYADLARSDPASATATAAALTVGAAVGPPRVKITVDRDAFYRVTYSDLIAAGFNLAGVDPRALRLSNRGQLVPMLAIGEADGVFDPGDYLLFYGSAVDDVYTGSNVYWLETGADNGLRMATVAGTVAAPKPATRFPATIHAEQNTVYWRGMPDGAGQDHYFWDNRLSPNSAGLPSKRTYSVTLDHIATGVADAQVRVRLRGYTSLAHRTRITFNGTAIDERTWSGQADFDHAVAVPHSLLHNGANPIMVEAIDAGAGVDQVLVDWIEVDYGDTYAAEGGELRFAAPSAGAWQFTVTGFPAADLLVFDITDPAAPQVISPTQVTPAGGEFTLAFQGQAGQDSRYLALSATAFAAPARLALDQPSHWKSPANGADYILITHRDFYSATLPLAERRQQDGLRVAVVVTEDLYDEFSGGIFTPQAIRDFLAYAYHTWQPPAPAYVLLVGDAVIDYRDYTKTGSINYVPTQIVETEDFGQTASDNWFAAVNGDDVLPDLYIGRLSATSSRQAADAIAKVIAYDQNPPSAEWNSRTLLVADDDEPAFAGIVDYLASRLPYHYAVHKVYVGSYPPGSPTADIAAYLREGSVLVTYAGHGEFFRWGKWNDETAFILGLSDIATLDNAQRLPFVAVGDCANGFFAGPQQEISLAEAFQRQPNGGAVAVWAPTGLGAPTSHRLLLAGLYDAIYQDDLLHIGAAAAAAKIKLMAQGTFWHELVETYVLFGDPYTRLGIAPNHPYVAAVSPAPGATGVPLDQEFVVEFSKPVDPATVALTSDDLPALTPTWNAGFTRASFAHGGLSHGRQVTLQLTAQDRAGSPLRDGPVPIPWTFTVTTDTTPPTGSIIIDQGNPTGVTLRLRFSEPVRSASVALTFTPAVAGNLMWESIVDAVFVPETGFVTGQAYGVSASAAIDLAGNVLTTPLTFSFTAGGEPFSPGGVYLPFVGNIGGK